MNDPLNHRSAYAVVVIPTKKGALAGLTDPGAPVYSIRDQLHGWVVEATNGDACVHAPTEGDGHVHCMERDVWALELWWLDAPVYTGWDRARRVCTANAVTGVGVNMTRGLFDPLPDEVLLLAHAMEAAGLCRVVTLDLADGAVRERAP